MLPSTPLAPFPPPPITTITPPSPSSQGVAPLTGAAYAQQHFAQNRALQEQLRKFWADMRAEVERVSTEPSEFKAQQLPLARIKKVRGARWEEPVSWRARDALCINQTRGRSAPAPPAPTAPSALPYLPPDHEIRRGRAHDLRGGARAVR